MMIAYTEKGRGLHNAIAAAGHWLRQDDGVWQCSDPTAVQAIVDAYPLTATQAEVIARIDALAAEIRNRVVGSTSPAEMAAWTIKRSEAAAYDGSAASAPTLAIEAAARGVDLATLVAKVQAKSTALATLEAQIAGAAGRHADAVKAVATFADVLAYDYRGGWPV